MKAVTFQAPYSLKYAEVDDPVAETPADAIVRVDVAAICGSDLHVYRGHETGLDVGTVMGHEFLGEIVAIGSEVPWRAGTRVVSVAIVLGLLLAEALFARFCDRSL